MPTTTPGGPGACRFRFGKWRLRRAAPTLLVERPWLEGGGRHERLLVDLESQPRAFLPQGA